MRKFIFIALLFYSGTDLYSQGILEGLYNKLPNEFCMGKTGDEKKYAIDEMKQGFKDGSNGTFIDEKNGYLCYNIYQCTYEICYWTITNSGKTRRIVAVNGADDCSNHLYFFSESNDGSLVRYKVEGFNGFNAFYFFKEEAKLKDMKEFANYFTFSLPRKGLDITCRFESIYGMSEENSSIKGDKIDFKWNNGDFKRGEPYF